MKFYVDFYLEEKGYGFIENESGERYFFRGENFFRRSPEHPMPISGEEVSVGYTEDREKGSSVAKEVKRLSSPQQTSGVVESFDTVKGWGFIREYGNQTKVYLHVSDLSSGWVPIKGSRVKFCKGWKKGRPRACYVKEDV